MFRRVAVGLVASAATLLTGVPAHAAAAASPRPAQPNVASARAAHPPPAHRHRDAVKRVPATAAKYSKREGGSGATTLPAPAAVLAIHAAVRPAAGTPATSYASAAAPARAPPAGQ